MIKSVKLNIYKSILGLYYHCQFCNINTYLSSRKQISYGRFFTKQKGKCEIDLFIVQADGKKMVDPFKQNALSSRLRMELYRPLRVAVVSRGPDTELLVANPVELSGKGRPLVFYDMTLALKMLNTCIFLVISLLLTIIIQINIGSAYKCLGLPHAPRSLRMFQL